MNRFYITKEFSIHEILKNIPQNPIKTDIIESTFVSAMTTTWQGVCFENISYHTL